MSRQMPEILHLYTITYTHTYRFPTRSLYPCCTCTG